jgi:hypothetical protein
MNSNTCSARGSIDLPISALAAFTGEDITAPFLGAAVGDMVVLYPSSVMVPTEADPSFVPILAEVLSPGVLAFRVENTGAGTFADPFTQTVRVVIIRATGSV